MTIPLPQWLSITTMNVWNSQLFWNLSPNPEQKQIIRLWSLPCSAGKLVMWWLLSLMKLPPSDVVQKNKQDKRTLYYKQCKNLIYCEKALNTLFVLSKKYCIIFIGTEHTALKKIRLSIAFYSTYSISQKWVHPSHFFKYFIISLNVTTLKKWHFAIMWSSECTACIAV